ncbi:hypothetical protein [Runella sp.]|uniref:hypothetical protein n=1 Tax=Runella sp. TaxID=1960881 RepID=UPI002604F5F5|nr:hypothetical protein [Runella sp.]
MPLIPNRANFEPTQNSLSKWLGTRKSKIQISNSSIHGLYSDFNFSEDARWFWIGIIGELAGILLIFIGAAKKGSFFVGVAMVLAIAFVFCDIFFANRLHRNVAKRCWIDSMLDIIGTSNPIRTQELTLKKEEGKNLDLLLKAAIILIGVIKIVGVVALGTIKSAGFYVPVLIMYGLVCYVHLLHTGYYLIYSRTEKLFKQDYVNFAQGQNTARSLSHPFETQSELVNIPIRIGDIVEIDKDPNNSDKNHFKYILKTKGILIDEDIALLMAGQQPQNRDRLAYECRYHQITNMSVALA